MAKLSSEEARVLSKYRSSISYGYCSDVDFFFALRSAKKDLSEGNIDIDDIDILNSIIERYNTERDIRQKELQQQASIKSITNNSHIAENKPEYNSNDQPDNSVKCPKCGSHSIYSDKKGYGLGKGVAGLALFGAIGLLGGMIGKNKVISTCLKCGHKFNTSIP
ncbi:MAG: hypothetical protein Q7U54_13065 [Bacteroidales bacterium]|nr:hypothetical protein [Bacteroidales bacterium]